MFFSLQTPDPAVQVAHRGLQRHRVARAHVAQFFRPNLYHPVARQTVLGLEKLRYCGLDENYLF